MGRRRATGDARQYRLGQHREVARDHEPFRAYLTTLTLRTYLRDFFAHDNFRVTIGFVVGVICFLFGIGRVFVHPDLQSLGVILVGFAIAALFLMLPLLIDVVFASVGSILRFGGRTGRRRR